jgi:hypothetical protein
MTAKTRAIPSLHRDNFVAPPAAGYRDAARCCRRVTQPPFIAGPLGVTIIMSIITITDYFLAACPDNFAGNS